MTLNELKQIKDSLDKGVIVSKPSWLEVLDWAIELTKYHEGGVSGWLAWTGGDTAPVKEDAHVDFYCRGKYGGASLVKHLDWSHNDHADDIILYKVRP